MVNELNRVLFFLRCAKEISSTNLSKKTKISKSYISEIENDRKPVTLSVLSIYSDYFDVPISAIFLMAELMKDGRKLTQEQCNNLPYSDEVKLYITAISIVYSEIRSEI